MPSTVVLLSFLFLPALSEDLGKESCGRKVEPARGVRGFSRCVGGLGQDVPSVPSIPSSSHCSGISQAQALEQAPTEQSGQGGDSVCLSSPNALTQPELLSSLPRVPKSLCWLLGRAQLPALLPNPPGTALAAPWYSPAWYLCAGSSRSGWRARPQRCCRWHRRLPGSGRTGCHPPRMHRTVGTQRAQQSPGCGDRAAPAPARPLPRRELTVQRDKSSSEGQRLSQPRRHPESSHQEQGWEQPLGPLMALQPPRGKERQGWCVQGAPEGAAPVPSPK